MKKTFFFTLFFITLSIVFFPACNKRKTSSNKEIETWNSTHVEARLYDVPILIDAKLFQVLKTTENGDNAIISYSSRMSLKDIVMFYQENMERFGWRQIMNFSSDKEVLLNFEKPKKYCSVSLRFSSSVVCVVLFCGQKLTDNRSFVALY